MTSPLSWRRSPVTLAAVLGALALVVGALLIVALLVPGVRQRPVALLAGLLPGHAVAFLVVVGLLLRRWRLRFADLGFRRPTLRLLHLLWQVPALLVVAATVQALAITAAGAPAQQRDGVDLILRGSAPELIPVAAVGIVVLVPIWEEAVFRGVIRGGLRRRLPAWIAVLASAALFALAHAAPPVMLYLFIVGVGLALLVEFHRTFWASVLTHAADNAVVLVVALGALGSNA